MVDLKTIRAVQEIAVRFLEDQNQRIFHPTTVEILVSEDGTDYESVYRVTNDVVDHRPIGIRRFGTELRHKETRFVRIIARNIAQSPAWHTDAGTAAWLFTDEIIIR